MGSFRKIIIKKYTYEYRIKEILLYIFLYIIIFKSNIILYKYIKYFREYWKNIKKYYN